MIGIDIPMPENCMTCPCSIGWGCGITKTVLLSRDMAADHRPKECPLIDLDDDRK